MVRQVIIQVFCSLLIIGTAVAQADLHPISQADSLEQINSKPMVVLLSAPWCNWCQKMKMQSLSDKRLDASMNERFYFFELNVEDTADIVFGSRNFSGATENKNHQLAMALSDQPRVTVPTLLIFNEMQEIVFQHASYLTPNELVAILSAMK